MLANQALARFTQAMLSLFDRRLASEIEVAHDGETYRIALRRMPTSRRYTLRVRAGMVNSTSREAARTRNV